jgi:hypothetical protein
MKQYFVFLLLLVMPMAHAERYIGNLGGNPYDANSSSNRFGAGSQYGADSINNPYGRYGSRFSSEGVTNPYSTSGPKLYDNDGNYRGRLNSNRFDPDSVSNPYGRYGNKYSPDSINNPYGAGNRFRQDSPSNPYGTGLRMYGE